jgi:hypothetical protein
MLQKLRLMISPLFFGRYLSAGDIGDGTVRSSQASHAQGLRSNNLQQNSHIDTNYLTSCLLLENKTKLED